MKASQIQNILVLFVLSMILHGQVQGTSFQEENKTERQGGYIRQRNLSHCPYTVGTPCWGVQVCRGGKPECVPPMNVFNSDLCGDCKTSPDENADDDGDGYANPQGGVIEENTGNKRKVKPKVYIPNAAHCPHSETSPCYGIPVCRVEDGEPVNRCMEAGYVLKNDKCGYCDDNGGTDNQENDEEGNATPQGGTNSQNNPDDETASTGDQETGDGIPNAANCPRSETYPCYGIPVCRTEDGEGVSFCVQSGSVFETDKCGFCDQENDGVGNATPQDIGSQVDHETEDGIIKENKGNAKPRVYIPNAANCPHSEKSPCFGIPVCRMENGGPVDRCMAAGYVLKSDKCGYCDDEK